ncbi:MAG TPA: copper resistance protein B [Sphingomicrobium sp.]|nr:copper resistance protein B [Sphingomicrobium sp.]
MRTLLLLLGTAALAVTSPATAQHAHHHGHHMPAPAKKKPAPKPKAPVKKPVAKKAPAKTAAVKKAAPAKTGSRSATPRKPSAKIPVRKPAVDPHAGHAEPAAGPDPHAGHNMPAASADPHAGHAMPATPSGPHAGHADAADPHAGHDPAHTAVDPPVAPPPAAAFAGPENAADSVWGGAPMALSRRAMIDEHGNVLAYKLLVDRAETRFGSGRDIYLVDGEAWIGGDKDKAWFKAEVEGRHGGRPESAELQALWSHAIDPWFDLQTGVRFDVAGKRRGHLVLGVQGLAPYWIHVDGAAFLSGKGDLTASLEAEHDMRITQRLVLQPRAEIALAAQDVEDQGLGAGLSSVELGARLRFQLRPEFAPYVGVSVDQAFGRTRRFRREEGEKPSDLRLLAGIRTWF